MPEFIELYGQLGAAGIICVVFLYSQRHREAMVKELNDLSDVMMEVKGSVSRINGK